MNINYNTNIHTIIIVKSILVTFLRYVNKLSDIQIKMIKIIILDPITLPEFSIGIYRRYVGDGGQLHYYVYRLKSSEISLKIIANVQTSPHNKWVLGSFYSSTGILILIQGC